jgi:hypothetical protein
MTMVTPRKPRQMTVQIILTGLGGELDRQRITAADEATLSEEIISALAPELPRNSCFQKKVRPPGCRKTPGLPNVRTTYFVAIS